MCFLCCNTISYAFNLKVTKNVEIDNEGEINEMIRNSHQLMSSYYELEKKLDEKMKKILAKI